MINLTVSKVPHVLVLAFTLLIMGCGEKQAISGRIPTTVFKTFSGESFTLSAEDKEVTLLVFWATWCQPCVEEFPELVRIRRGYADSVLEMVCISVDYPDEAESKVLPFLHDHRVTFPVFIADMTKQDEFINAIEPSWSGAVPATFIFDAGGRRRAFLLGRRTFESFKAHVDSAFVAR